MKDLFQVLGEFLQAKRLKVGLSQGDVAQKLGYSSPQFVSNFERGLCAPPLEKLKVLVSLYSVNGEEVPQADAERRRARTTPGTGPEGEKALSFAKSGFVRLTSPNPARAGT
jgi:transcriptional regulator with XRE-family HTH domain